MQLKKHLYLQKPLTHDIYEARILTQASEKYKVVTQIGDQGASCDGMRTLREWIEAGILGEMSGLVFPGRYITYKWDGENMRITNFEQANRFVRREYRKGWGEIKL